MSDGIHKIEFVEYTGHCPSLCFGDLIVKIDGKPVCFCSLQWDEDKQRELDMPCYPYFWVSGGGHTISDNGGYIVTEAPYELCVEDYDKKNYPAEILDLLPDILEVMNANVPHGCCGGCL